MALLHSKYARGTKRVPQPETAGQVVVHRFVDALPVTVDAADIIEWAPIPAYCRVLDIIVDAEDLDDATALVFDVGVMSGKFGESLDDDGNARTSGAEFFSASTLGQAGGMARLTLAGGLRVAPVAYDRGIGIKVTTAAGTPAAGNIGLTITYGFGE